MRLRPDQLRPSLERKGLASMYLICGDEPLQMTEALDTLRSYARDQGISERVVLTVEVGFDWNALKHEVDSYSLFSSKRLIELRLGGSLPGTAGAAVLTQHATVLPPDVVLVISAAKIDKKTQQSPWFKAVDKGGVVIQVWPVESGALPQWIMQRMSARGRRLSSEAAAFIAERVEGNLLAAKQELELLQLLNEGPEIELADVLSAVSDSSRYGVFELIDGALAGKLQRTLRVLEGLRSEGVDPVLIHWVLARELRSLCIMATGLAAGKPVELLLTECRVWDQRKPLVTRTLRRHGAEELRALLLSAGRVERMIKGAIPGDAWDALTGVCVALAGRRAV